MSITIESPSDIERRYSTIVRESLAEAEAAKAKGISREEAFREFFEVYDRIAVQLAEQCRGIERLADSDRQPRLRSRKLLLSALVVLLSLAGCAYRNPPNAILIKSLPKPNPTVFVFNASVKEIGTALVKKQYDLLPDWSVETRADMIFDLTHAVLERPGNEHDGYLYSASGGTSRPSEVYFLPGGKPCEYGADFHVHLTRLGPATTKVEVFARRPWVYVGEQERELFPVFWHQRGIFVRVHPTTIEEYMILKNLGAALGVTNMPPVTVPGSNSASRQLRYKEADTIDFARDGKLSDWKPSF